MEEKNLDQVKELVDRIGISYDPPTNKETEEMQKLTGINWDAEDLQMICCEYWSHHSLEEVAYLMFHGEYPPVREVELSFWRYKPGVILDDQTVYENYRFGRKQLKALEALPLEEILQKIKDLFSGWQENTEAGSKERSWRFDCLKQAEYWTDTHFWIFEYGREIKSQREHQILRFCCHNMSDEQIAPILKCMSEFQCPLHIQEEKNFGNSKE